MEEENIYMDHNQMHSLEKMTLFFHALNHPLRQEILAVLDENKDSENSLTVTDIRTKIKQEQSVTSQQLAILLESGLVTKEQKTHDRRYFYYKLNLEKLELANQLIELFTPKSTPLGKSKEEKAKIL